MKRGRCAWVWKLGLAMALMGPWILGQASSSRQVSAAEALGAAEVFSELAVLAVAQADLRSFRYQDGKSLKRFVDIRRHEVKVPAVRGEVFVYATFEMTPTNPVPYRSDHPQAVQIVTVGESRAGVFFPAVRFGLHDGKGVPGEQSQLVPWVSDGRLDYYGGYARPNTPYDFKLKLDLRGGRLSVSTSGRGDDDWFQLVEDAPLINRVSEINEGRVEQYPGAPDIHSFLIRSEPWRDGESVRPHPQAKSKRLVKPKAGFKLQSMRSLWRRPGRHVTISRDQSRWQGFADVVSSPSGRLLTTYCDGPRHGGHGKSVIRVSEDLGKTWGPERLMVASNGTNERLQRLRDGSLLFVSGEELPTVEIKRSTDDGETWTAVGGFDLRTFGLKKHYAMSHILETSDGTWFTVSSDIVSKSQDFQNHPRERLQVFRSKDLGKTWEFRALLDTYPSSGHSGSEASILEMPDGRLVIYAREGRNDGYPGFRVFSQDGGKTWSQPEDLPIQIRGRVKADFLSDGRIMLTTRSTMGRQALWAWVEDPQANIGFQIGGIHFNDRSSKGLKDGALYIDNDGRGGQFTRYLLRPPHGAKSRIELTAEVLVKENQGHSATIAIPFAGQVRILPDHVDFVGSESISITIAPDRYHTYRLTSGEGQLKLFVDGKLKLETSKLDNRRIRHAHSPPPASPLLFSFGNYPHPEMYPPGRDYAGTDMVAPQITPEVTGLSLWKRVETTVTDVSGRVHRTSWVAARDGFPDQYQLDQVLEIEASVFGSDQGYSGWTELPDGRIFVVNYTDDTAAAWPATNPYLSRCSWIRGTYVLSSDLPSAGN